MEMTIVDSRHEGLGTNDSPGPANISCNISRWIFLMIFWLPDTFQGWLAIKTLISGEITNIPKKSWRNRSCFFREVSHHLFIHSVGLKKMKLFKTFVHLFMFFSKTKDEDLCHFQFPPLNTWRIQALQPRRRWKNVTVKAPRTDVLPTPGRITSPSWGSWETFGISGEHSKSPSKLP